MIQARRMIQFRARSGKTAEEKLLVRTSLVPPRSSCPPFLVAAMLRTAVRQGRRRIDGFRNLVGTGNLDSREVTETRPGAVRLMAVDSTADTPQLRRLMYHAKQRGWLELDLIVGNWAEANRRALVADPALMADFEALLAVENPDLYKYLTGQLEPPEEEEALKRNAVYRTIRSEIEDSYPIKARPLSKPWLPSGWHDR